MFSMNSETWSCEIPTSGKMEYLAPVCSLKMTLQANVPSHGFLPLVSLTALKSCNLNAKTCFTLGLVVNVETTSNILTSFKKNLKPNCIYMENLSM